MLSTEKTRSSVSSLDLGPIQQNTQFRHMCNFFQAIFGAVKQFSETVKDSTHTEYGL